MNYSQPFSDVGNKCSSSRWSKQQINNQSSLIINMNPNIDDAVNYKLTSVAEINI